MRLLELDEPEWIQCEPGHHQAFGALVSFLDKATANPTVVESLAVSTVISLHAEATQSATYEQYMLEVQTTFGILLTVVMQIEAATSRQDHLVQLVLSFRQMLLASSSSTSLSVNMDPETIALINVFKDLEYDAPLHPHLEGRQGVSPPAPERPPWRQEPGHYMTARSWTNLSAFMARLHCVAPDLPLLALRGLYAMIEALEQLRTPEQLEDVLPAAAYWFICAGNTLRNNDTPYDNNEDNSSRRLPWSKGQLWSGQHAFSQARWEFWQQRFLAIANRNDVSDVVRLAAFHAHQAGSYIVLLRTATLNCSYSG